MRRKISYLFITSLLFSITLIIQPANAIDRTALRAALSATVLVLVPYDDGDLCCSGSGTVMTTEGHILTNFHVIGDRETGELFNEDGLAVIGVMPTDLKGAPILKYQAQFIDGDPELDLSVLQIVGLWDDPDEPLPDNLGLFPIEMGDSDDLMIGDPIHIYGYPGLGGDTVTYTAGIVSGFLDEDRNAVYEWIKTDAEINHGNSGGLATDDAGRFAGVPTRGFTDMEAAGKISHIRSGNIAQDFFNSIAFNSAPPARSGSAQILEIEYTEAINRRGKALNPQVRFNSSITDLYAVFEHKGFQDGAIFTYIWYVNGFEDGRDSFEWEGGKDGSSWVNIYNEEGLPDGFYELEIMLDGNSIHRGGVVVGEAGEPRAEKNSLFGEITFAQAIDEVDGTLIEPATTFGIVSEIYASFGATEMVNGAVWSAEWYYEDQLALEQEEVWDSGESASYWVSLSHPDGLPAGDYELQLFIEGELSQSGEFSIVDEIEDKLEDATAQVVNLIGNIYNRDNSRKKISGALIVFLSPGILVDDWIDASFDEEMIHAEGTSNRRGNYQLNNSVVSGELYSVVVVHDDYQLLSIDGYQVPEDAGDPYELEVPMDAK